MARLPRRLTAPKSPAKVTRRCPSPTCTFPPTQTQSFASSIICPTGPGVTMRPFAAQVVPMSRTSSAVAPRPSPFKFIRTKGSQIVRWPCTRSTLTANRRSSPYRSRRPARPRPLQPRRWLSRPLRPSPSRVRALLHLRRLRPGRPLTRARARLLPASPCLVRPRSRSHPALHTQ